MDKIEEEEITYEKQEGIIAWRGIVLHDMEVMLYSVRYVGTHDAGQNKDKMKCCVITGRNLDPINRTGTHRSFKRVRPSMLVAAVPH